MNADLQKRLEEEYGCPITELTQEDIDHFLWLEGRKKESYILGYKEAIAQAKKWLEEKIYTEKYWGRDDEGPFLDADELLVDFESDMNKLWEEKK